MSMAQQIWTRLQLLFAQGKVTVVGQETIQVAVLSDEPLQNIKRIEPYGYSYRPHPGAQAYLVFPSGDRSQGIALVVGDKRYQMTLQPGEVALHDDEGNHVHLKRGGVIEVKASSKVIADTPLFECTQNAKIGGNLLVMGNTTSTGGFLGADGGSAEMKNGAKVLTTFTVNGKDVSDGHRHMVNAEHEPSSGVM